ncbi:hypothetical protein GQX74_009950 [Glossina fuscipes]|nr:hypothetical protein GQX74_009950 [Glossina fuscipes]
MASVKPNPITATSEIRENVKESFDQDIHEDTVRKIFKKADYHGERASPDVEAAKKFILEIPQIIEEGEYSADQIFNADETNLYWKRMSSPTFISKNEKQAPEHWNKQGILHWKEFSILDCVTIIALVGKELNQSTLHARWKPLLHQMVQRRNFVPNSNSKFVEFNLAPRNDDVLKMNTSFVLMKVSETLEAKDNYYLLKDEGNAATLTLSTTFLPPFETSVTRQQEQQRQPKTHH